MARTHRRPVPLLQHTLRPSRQSCWECGTTLWVAYHTVRTVTTLDDVCHLTFVVRRCRNRNCSLYHRPYRPEEEGCWALPHCYDIPDLPRTNNDLELYFGSARYHERRATGRKSASPGLVVRGSVRVMTSVASRLHHFDATELRLTDPAQWRILRSELDDRHEARRRQHRFRKSPENYLTALEEKLIKERLPT